MSACLCSRHCIDLLSCRSRHRYCLIELRFETSHTVSSPDCLQREGNVLVMSSHARERADEAP